MRGTMRAVAMVSALLMVTSCGAPAQPSKDAPRKGKHPGGTETVGFLYQRIRSEKDLDRLGDVDVVVSVRQVHREADAVKLIHQRGAQAVRYLQSYWYPVGRHYDGFSIGDRTDLAFCSKGKTPVRGQKDKKYQEYFWYFIDANEREFRRWFRGLLARLKKAGYDGVMFDRGYAALTGIDTEPAGIWNKVSSCTNDPYTKGATFADAYVGMMNEVKKSKLKLMQNYGHSPFYPDNPFRPDPKDPDCDKSVTAKNCGHVTYGRQAANWFLDEAAAHPKAELWAKDFEANRRNEKNKRLGGKVIGLITEGVVGGKPTRDNVYYAYGRIRLWDMPVAVGTGNDRCPGRRGMCNRFGSFPELVGARWGKPVSLRPRSARCTGTSTTECIWWREYENGVVAVNATKSDRTLTMKLDEKLCGDRVELFTGKKVGAGCVGSIKATIPAWSARLFHVKS